MERLNLAPALHVILFPYRPACWSVCYTVEVPDIIAFLPPKITSTDCISQQDCHCKLEGQQCNYTKLAKHAEEKKDYERQLQFKMTELQLICKMGDSLCLFLTTC